VYSTTDPSAEPSGRSLRLEAQEALERVWFVQLIEGGRRIFGIDREGGEWHIHPYDAPDKHEPLPEGLGPRPLLEFLARVEDLLLQHDLL
jgi:hypothetical protein